MRKKRLKKFLCMTAVCALFLQNTAAVGSAEEVFEEEAYTGAVSASVNEEESISFYEEEILPQEDTADSAVSSVPEESTDDAVEEDAFDAQADGKADSGEADEAQPMTGEEVAESIRTVILAAGELENADDSGMERLQEYIEETREGFNALPQEEQEMLSESLQAFENACVSVDVYETAAQQMEEAGTIQQDLPLVENSWRYINGQPIYEALQTVDREAQELPEEDLQKKSDSEKLKKAKEAGGKKRTVDIEGTEKTEKTENTESTGGITEAADLQDSSMTETEDQQNSDAAGVEEQQDDGVPATEEPQDGGISATEELQEEDMTQMEPDGTEESSAGESEEQLSETEQQLPQPEEAGPAETYTEEEIIPTQEFVQEPVSESMPDAADGNEEMTGDYEEPVIFSGEPETRDAYEEAGPEEEAFAVRADRGDIPVAATAMARMTQDEDTIVFLTSDAERHWGIDVSEWQGSIDWQKAKASGVEFAILRCGYSSAEMGGRDDYYWARNVSECESLGIPYGVYLYSHATDASMIDGEVRHVLSLLQGHRPALPVYIDMEEKKQSLLGADALSDLASRFCQQISAAGYAAGLYSSRSWYNSYFGSFAADPSWYHWVAEWDASCAYGGRYEMWQYSCEGGVSGISGYVDANYWYRSLPPQTAGGTTTVPDGLYYIASALDRNMVLDVAGASKSSGANIYLQKKAQKASQVFRLESAGGGYYHILNYNSGMALDVHGASTANSANIQQYRSNGTGAQLWALRQNSDGSYTLVNKNSGKAADAAGGRTAAGTNIAQYTVNGTGAQKFLLEKTTAPAAVKPTAAPVDKKPRISVNGVTGMDGTYTITSAVRSNLALDVYGASVHNGANIWLYAANGTAAQQFQFISAGDGYYEIVNVRSGMAIDVYHGSAANHANIQQYTRNGTDAQIWRLVQYSDGTYGLINKKSGKALTIQNGSIQARANIWQTVQSGENAQRFLLNRIQTSSEYEGTWIIASATNHSLVWDISGASRRNGGNLQLYSWNNTNAQKFRITSVGNGFYEIVNVNSGLAVDVKGAGRKNGVNIQQYNRNRTGAQQWQIRKNADGTLTFLNKNSGRAADVRGASFRSRTNIHQYADNGTKAQRFVLIQA